MASNCCRVILCADGDSCEVDLWSNVPFLLGKELERRGLELIRVNLAQPVWIKRLWRSSIWIRWIGSSLPLPSGLYFACGEIFSVSRIRWISP